MALRASAALTPRYLAEADADVLRLMDPELAARCFVGPAAMQVFAHRLLRLPDLPDVDKAPLFTAQVGSLSRGLQR